MLRTNTRASLRICLNFIAELDVPVRLRSTNSTSSYSRIDTSTRKSSTDWIYTQSARFPRGLTVGGGAIAVEERRVTKRHSSLSPPRHGGGKRAAAQLSSTEHLAIAVLQRTSSNAHSDAAVETRLQYSI